jgi:hypothetical protein
MAPGIPGACRNAVAKFNAFGVKPSHNLQCPRTDFRAVQSNFIRPSVTIALTWIATLGA